MVPTFCSKLFLVFWKKKNKKTSTLEGVDGILVKKTSIFNYLPRFYEWFSSKILNLKQIYVQLFTLNWKLFSDLIYHVPLQRYFNLIRYFNQEKKKGFRHIFGCFTRWKKKEEEYSIIVNILHFAHLKFNINYLYV